MKVIHCHNGPNTSNPDWGTPISIAGSHTATTNGECDNCHKDSNITTLALVDFHNASLILADTNDCISCHTQDQRGYPSIDIDSFTNHSNVNITGGRDNLTNDDCTTCHYDFDYEVMNATDFTTPTRSCDDCHATGTNGAPVIKNHKQNGLNITISANCYDCHNNSISKYAYSSNGSSSHYGTNSSLIDTAYCTWCHKNSANGTKWGGAADPWTSATFPHSIENTPKEDCYACHNSAPDFHNAALQKPSTSTLTCLDCHRTDRTIVPGGAIGTEEYCSTCHINSINEYNFSVNASVSHYGTISSLVKPTVNQTSLPRYGFFNQTEAVAYNLECNNCHSPQNLSYGTPTNITFGHTRTATCSQCHINATADNLHNSSLEMPVTFSCILCHTTYADRYNAPNLTGTTHQGYDCQTLMRLLINNSNSYLSITPHYNNKEKLYLILSHRDKD